MKLVEKSKNFFDIMLNLLDLARIIIVMLATKKGRKNDKEKQTTEGASQQ